MMELAAIEALLLDTLEKEGEDNKLFHVCEQGVSRWSDLRGVFAAAMGTMKSVAGEPLVFAQFVGDQDAASKPTVVGFVDLNEVLFVMVFVECTLPQKIIEYYTRSSCELLVSLLGYPSQKLRNWHDEAKEDTEDKVARMCRRVFEGIRRDLRWETHLQFAFDGSVPAATYPLESMARLSAFQVIEPVSDTVGRLLFYGLCTETSSSYVVSVQYEVEGYALFFHRMLVVAKTTPSILKLLHQWLLFDDFDAEAEAGDGSSLSLFAWFDPHYALYGTFPSLHSLVRIRHDDVQCFYILRHLDSSAYERYRRDPTSLISIEDLEELLHFADTRLRRHYEATLLDRRNALAQPDQPVWYCVVLDKLRHTLHGFKPSDLFAGTNQHVDPFSGKPLLELLACQPSESFQRQRMSPADANDTDASVANPLPTRKHWTPRITLDFDSHHELLLRPVRPEDDAGADISSEEAQIFPPVDHQLENEAVESLRKYPGGELHQEAERLCLADGRLVWVLANYYEVFDLFAVCDAAIPITRLEQEMETLLKLD